MEQNQITSLRDERCMVVAANRRAAEAFAKEHKLKRWFYLSAPELGYGIHQAVVCLVPGYENHKDYHSIKTFLDDLRSWGPAYGISFREEKPSTHKDHVSPALSITE